MTTAADAAPAGPTGDIRSADHGDWTAASLAAAKGDHVVSVCFPARNEATTIAPIVRTVREALVERHGLVDEVLVLDDHSTDGTDAVAAEAGARVVRAEDVFPEHAGGYGKGEAVWRSLYAATGDLIAWCDADIADFTADFVVGLLGPLLTDPTVALVKGFYHRPGEEEGETGGRVTELLARPLIAALFPELASVQQPLSGEYAGRREVLEALPIATGYGVDLALLVDVARTHGTDAIVQVDLGERRHRNRPLAQLGPQALEVLQAAMDRAGLPATMPAVLRRPGLPPLERSFTDLPPLSSLREA